MNKKRNTVFGTMPMVTITLPKNSVRFSVSGPLYKQLGDRVRIGYDDEGKCLVMQAASDDDIYTFSITKRGRGQSGMLAGSDMRGLVEWLKEKGIYGRYLMEYDKGKDVWKSTEFIQRKE